MPGVDKDNTNECYRTNWTSAASKPQGCSGTVMQETDIIGGANPSQKIHDNWSGGFTDLKNVQKKPVFLGFSERSVFGKKPERKQGAETQDQLQTVDQGYSKYQ